MSQKQYDLYVKDCALRGITPFPNDMGTPPDVFGRTYLGSSKKRNNTIRRKRLARAAA
jgi:hypothetical protein